MMRHMLVQESVAEEIRVAIARRNVTHKAVADALGLTRSQFSRRINGHIEFTSSELATLARVLRTPVGTFFGEPGTGASS